MTEKIPHIPDGFSVDLTDGEWHVYCEECYWQSDNAEDQAAVVAAVALAEEHQCARGMEV